jgi:putative ABC transport system permease protein
VESVLLALLGCVAGLVLGAWAVRLIVSNMPAEIARWIAGWSEIRLDLGVLAATIVVAALAGVIAGLVPALHASGPNLSEALREGSRGASCGRERQRLRSALVVLETALALVLLTGATLTGKGLRTLIDQNRGFEPDTLLTMAVSLPDSKYGQPQQQAAFYRRALLELEAIPGVRSASVSTTLPFSPTGWRHDRWTIENRPPSSSGDVPFARTQVVSPSYFRTLRIPLLRGREFGGQDSPDSMPAAIVGETFARRYWPGQDALGRRLKLNRAPNGGRSGGSRPGRACTHRRD